jgi:hypothetical protein
MTEKPVSVDVKLPHRALSSANWADCYMLEVRGRRMTALDAAHLALDHSPAWARLLMRIRDAVAGRIGLKTTGYHAPGSVPMIGMFPIISRSDDQVVLGFDDRHLDFRLVIDVHRLGDDRQRVSATTLVHRKILLGRIYIAVITPFHKLIVASMLANLGRQNAVT